MFLCITEKDINDDEILFKCIEYKEKLSDEISTEIDNSNEIKYIVLNFDHFFKKVNCFEDINEIQWKVISLRLSLPCLLLGEIAHLEKIDEYDFSSSSDDDTSDESLNTNDNNNNNNDNNNEHTNDESLNTNNGNNSNGNFRIHSDSSFSSNMSSDIDRNSMSSEISNVSYDFGSSDSSDE